MVVLQTFWLLANCPLRSPWLTSPHPPLLGVLKALFICCLMRQTLKVAQAVTNSNTAENNLDPLVLLPPLLQ